MSREFKSLNNCHRMGICFSRASPPAAPPADEESGEKNIQELPKTENIPPPSVVCKFGSENPESLKADGREKEPCEKEHSLAHLLGEPFVSKLKLLTSSELSRSVAACDSSRKKEEENQLQTAGDSSGKEGEKENQMQMESPKARFIGLLMKSLSVRSSVSRSISAKHLQTEIGRRFRSKTTLRRKGIGRLYVFDSDRGLAKEAVGVDEGFIRECGRAKEAEESASAERSSDSSSDLFELEFLSC